MEEINKCFVLQLLAIKKNIYIPTLTGGSPVYGVPEWFKTRKTMHTLFCITSIIYSFFMCFESLKYVFSLYTCFIVNIYVAIGLFLF